MAVQCRKCPYVVSAQPGERQPPWCPRCGANLQELASAAMPALVGAAVGREAPRHAASDTPVSTPWTEPAPRDPEPMAHEAAEGDAGEIFASKWVWHGVAWLCVLVCLGIVAIAGWQLLHPPRGKPIQNGVYGVIGLFSIATLVAAYVALRLAGQKYAVFADRLVEWQWFAPTTIRWDQIREVFQDAHPGWTKYRVVTRFGRVLTIAGETRQHKRLGDLIAGYVAALKLPVVWPELEAGRDVVMGPLRISGAGVTIDGQLEPWHRIGVLTFGLNPNSKPGTSRVSRMLHVRIGSFWVELGDIPNYRLFEELARRLFPACVGSSER
jgi:Family of unknown function (DUF6585)